MSVASAGTRVAAEEGIAHERLWALCRVSPLTASEVQIVILSDAATEARLPTTTGRDVCGQMRSRFASVQALHSAAALRK